MSPAFGIALVLALVICLFVAVVIGMTVSTFAANVFAVCVLAAAVIVVWWRWLPKKGEP